VRISEALGQRWDGVDLTASERTAGTVRVEGTKTDASRRTIPLEPALAEVLNARAARLIDSTLYVFPSPLTGGPRDRRNVSRHLRDVLDRAGYPWATPHAFRRTVATLSGRGWQADQSGGQDPRALGPVHDGPRVPRAQGDTTDAAEVLTL
jgi:integrase